MLHHLLLLFAPIAAQQEPVPELFQLAAEGPAVHKAIPADARSQALRLNSQLFGELFSDRPSLEPILIPLFADRVIEAKPLFVTHAYGGGRILVLNTDAPNGATSAISVVGDSIHAVFHTEDGAVRVLSRPDGSLVAGDLNSASPLTCATDVVANLERLDNEGLASTTGEVTLDLLVAYSADAAAAYGDLDGMIAAANFAVWESNAALANSDCQMRVNLVHTYDTGWSETGDHSDFLTNLQGNGDGQMDDVHTLRDEFGADMVVGIFQDDPSSIAGRAFDILCSLSASSEADAFCIVRTIAYTGQWTFVHEIGHLCGAQHDTSSGTASCSITSSCYGWVSASGIYESIMAKTSATRLGVFSNPCIPAPDGSPLGSTGAAENWATIEYTDEHVCSYRPNRSRRHLVPTEYSGATTAQSCMIDLYPNLAVTVQGFDVHLNAPAGDLIEYSVYLRPGESTWATSPILRVGNCLESAKPWQQAPDPRRDWQP